jgi:hypothetical protein
LKVYFFKTEDNENIFLTTTLELEADAIAALMQIDEIVYPELFEGEECRVRIKHRIFRIIENLPSLLIIVEPHNMSKSFFCRNNRKVGYGM